MDQSVSSTHQSEFSLIVPDADTGSVQINIDAYPENAPVSMADGFVWGRWPGLLIRVSAVLSGQSVPPGLVFGVHPEVPL
jgi:hypothetical protein